MAKPQTIRGRIIDISNGSFKDKTTGELVTFSPSLKVLETGTYDVYKVKVDRNTFEIYSKLVGLGEVEITGNLEKCPQPAVMGCCEIKELKPQKP